MRILYVEDEERLRDAMCRALRTDGHDVTVAADGDIGLRLALAEEFDVIICDTLLPKRNGFQICENVREHGVATPILMLTAKDGEWDEAEALDAGADDYIVKPFSIVALEAHLRALVRRGRGSSTPNVAEVDARYARQVVKFTSRNLDNSVELSISDDGVGIPADLRERVFERFVQLDESRRTDQTGAGLGLAIAREIALAHGGQVWVEDANPGARFVVRLPESGADK